MSGRRSGTKSAYCWTACSGEREPCTWPTCGGPSSGTATRKTRLSPFPARPCRWTTPRSSPCSAPAPKRHAKSWRSGRRDQNGKGSRPCCSRDRGLSPCCGMRHPHHLTSFGHPRAWWPVAPPCAPESAGEGLAHRGLLGLDRIHQVTGDAILPCRLRSPLPTRCRVFPSRSAFK